MAPQAAAEPALPVLPCRLSKHPTGLTHRAPVSLPPTAPATPGVSLSFSTYSSTSFPLSSAGSALSLRPPIHCGSAPTGHPASPQVPTRASGSHSLWKWPLCKVRAGCWTPAACPEHPPQRYPRICAWGKRLLEDLVRLTSPTHGPAPLWEDSDPRGEMSTLTGWSAEP